MMEMESIYQNDVQLHPRTYLLPPPSPPPPSFHAQRKMADAGESTMSTSRPWVIARLVFTIFFNTFPCPRIDRCAIGARNERFVFSSCLCCLTKLLALLSVRLDLYDPIHVERNASFAAGVSFSRVALTKGGMDRDQP